MYQCLGAVEKILPVHPPNFSNLKRKSIGDLNDYPMKRQAVMAPIEPAQPPRVIQPRPPPNGYPQTTSMNSSPSVTSTGKKRGRPSKADKEAQARANYSRSLEYPPITPAPLAPIALAPQREYASSPGYEIAGTSTEQKGKKRGKAGANDKSPTGGSYPLASPASTTETPRALPETIEQVGQTLSPRDHVAHSADARSPALQAAIQQFPRAQSQPQTNTLPPIQQHGPPRPPHFDQYRGPDPPRGLDPIFPNRDRSRSGSDQVSRETPSAAPPLASRT
jgi:hypothetical protein